MKRNSIGNGVHLHGEADDVNPEEIKERIQDIKKILEEHDRELVHNWDEMGFYFRLIPSATYTAPNEQQRHIQGLKLTKQSVSPLSHALMQQAHTRFLLP